MSDNVRSWGFVFRVLNPAEVEANQEDFNFEDRLESAGICLTYDGQFVYSQETAPYDELAGLDGIDATELSRVIQSCHSMGIDIDPTAWKAWNSVWYDGTDSYISEFSEFDASDGM